MTLLLGVNKRLRGWFSKLILSQAIIIVLCNIILPVTLHLYTIIHVWSNSEFKLAFITSVLQLYAKQFISPNVHVNLHVIIFSYKIPGQRQVKVTDYKQLESDTSINIEFNVVGQLQKWIRHPNKNKGFSLTLRSAFGVDEETRNFIDTPTPCHRQAGNSSSSRSSRDVAMSSSLSPSSSGRI